jgi:hypothetical protein
MANGTVLIQGLYIFLSVTILLTFFLVSFYSCFACFGVEILHHQGCTYGYVSLNLICTSLIFISSVVLIN